MVVWHFTPSVCRISDFSSRRRQQNAPVIWRKSPNRDAHRNSSAKTVTLTVDWGHRPLDQSPEPHWCQPPQLTDGGDGSQGATG